MRIPKLNREQRKMWDTLMFLLRLIILSVPLYLVLWLNVSLLPIQYLVAGQSEWVLGVIGLHATRDNLILNVGTGSPFTFFIGPDCTGWKSMLAFVALVFATLGASMKKRLSGIIAGIPLIYLGNLLRIVVVVLIERGFGFEAAVIFHDWLWQAGLIFIVLFVWLVWLKWDSLPERSGFLGRMSRLKLPLKRREVVAS